MLLYLLIKFACSILDSPLFTGELFPMPPPVRSVDHFHPCMKFSCKREKQRNCRHHLIRFPLRNRVNMSFLMPFSSFFVSSRCGILLNWISRSKTFRFLKLTRYVFCHTVKAAWLALLNLNHFQKMTESKHAFEINHGDCYSPKFNDLKIK